MAPGVGKTYEMLAQGARRKADGVDVVVGVVETHGRKDTEALTVGLEVLPRKPIEYRGRTLLEFDIDAALARKPAAAAGRRVRPLQRPRLAPSEALAGRRGADRRRRQRLDHAQHPAPGEPGRRGLEDHRRAPARDGAGPGALQGRRAGDRRHHAGRAAPAARRGQGLRAGDGAARLRELLQAREPDGAARAGAAPRRPGGRRRAGRRDAASRRRRALGGGRAHPGAGRAAIPWPTTWCAPAGAWPR